MFKYIVIVGIIVLAWCPWLKADEAMSILNARLEEMKEQPLFCAMTIHEETIHKVPFGYTGEVSYDCNITDPEYGVEKSRNTVFITFYKGLIGMPNKVVARNP